MEHYISVHITEPRTPLRRISYQGHQIGGADNEQAAVVSLITGGSLDCDVRVYQYRGSTIVFWVDCDDIEDVAKKVRRLGRGKVRFVVVGKRPHSGVPGLYDGLGR